MSVDAPRRGRWLPAVLFLVQLIVTAVVMGLLSIAVVFGFTYNPLDVLAFFNVFAIAGALNWICMWYEPKGPLPPEKIANQFARTLTQGLARGQRRTKKHVKRPRHSILEAKTWQL